MPANLTPQYKEAEARFREATTTEQKVACLEEMLRLLPKHKGTEKIQADLRRRLSKLTRAEASKPSGHRVPGEFVDREGPKQTILIGGPNAGKSALLGALTAATPEVAPYPYTTTRLLTGMMPVLDVQLQLVDGPAISREFVRPFMNSQIRAADLAVWVVSLGDDDLLGRAEEVRDVLAEWHVSLVPAGEGVGPVREREATLPALLAGTHADADGADLREELLLETLGPAWTLHRVSVTEARGLDELRTAIFDALHLVRVYTKTPGHKADLSSPFLLDRGSTVLNLAEAVHKEIAEGLTFARIWGRDAYDGQHVQRDHVLADGDVVELHA